MHAQIILALYVVMLALATSGCGRYPTPLYSARDIQRASVDTEQIVIGFLPVEDYQLLSRFHRLRDISFFTIDGTGANDEKLRVLSKVKFNNLQGITLLNCPRVTDDGIRYLSQIPSLRWLGLEGTSITDESLEIMSKDMNLTGVNVANCSNVTLNGLVNLARSETLTAYTFSAEALNQEDVVRIIKEFKSNLQWPDVVDLAGKLDAEYLKTIAQDLGFRLRVSRTGAMQSLGIQ